MAGLTASEEVLMMRLYNLRYIQMNYEPLKILEAKVQWTDITRKYGNEDFGRAVDKLLHHGLMEDHGKSGQVASLSKQGVDYALQLQNIKKYPAEVAPLLRTIGKAREMVWVCRKCGKSVKTKLKPDRGEYGKCNRGGYHEWQVATIGET